LYAPLRRQAKQRQREVQALAWRPPRERELVLVKKADACSVCSGSVTYMVTAARAAERHAALHVGAALKASAHDVLLAGNCPLRC
jgi:hypothetical protein